MGTVSQDFDNSFGRFPVPKLNISRRPPFAPNDFPGLSPHLVELAESIRAMRYSNWPLRIFSNRQARNAEIACFLLDSA